MPLDGLRTGANPTGPTPQEFSEQQSQDQANSVIQGAAALHTPGSYAGGGGSTPQLGSMFARGGPGEGRQRLDNLNFGPGSLSQFNRFQVDPSNPLGRLAGNPQQQGEMSNEDKLNALFDQLLAKHEESWGNTNQMLNAQAAAGTRYASAALAKMGGVMSGNWSGVQRQAANQAMQNWLRARGQWEQEHMDLEKDRLGFLYQSSEAERNREFEREMTEGGYAREDQQRTHDQAAGLAEAFGTGNDADWAGLEESLRGLGLSDEEIQYYMKYAGQFRRWGGA